MTLLLMLLLKSLLVFALSGTALLCLRRASASARHLVCLLTLAALLALPLFSVTLPAWHLTGLSSTDRLPPPLLAPKEASPAPDNGEAAITRSEAVSVPVQAPAGQSVPVSFPAPPALGAGGHLFPWSPIGLALYLLGVALAALRPLLGLWGIAHLRRACAPVADTPTLSLADDCTAALGLRRLPRFCRADVPVPMTWGWRRPVILLPSGSKTWPEGRLRSVLLHELAHVKRRDWPGHRVADLACAVYWFHPLVWLTARRLRAESEIACDDLVLASGIPAPDYARHLLDIAESLPPASRRPPYPAAIAMAQTSRIKGRITLILDKTLTRRTVTRRALLITLIPSAAALLTLSALRPSAKAQVAAAQTLGALSAGGISVNVPKGVSPLHYQASHMTLSQFSHSGVQRTEVSARGLTLYGAMSQPIASSPDLKINDTTLFAGITNAGKPGSPWWSATGAFLPTPVYDTAANRSMNDAVQERNPDNTPIPTHNVIFAFRLPAAAQGITFQYKLPGTSSSSNGAWPGKSQNDAGHTESQMFASTGGARIVTAAFPATLKKASIQIGIAAGTWRTTLSEAINSPGASPGTSRSSSDGLDFILSPAVETAKGLLLTVATTSTDDTRIVAIGSEGQTLFPSDIDGESVNSLDQITVHFSQPLTQIKAFQVQTRPFQWIEFKDIALQPVQTAATLTPVITQSEWQTPWTSSDVHSTWDPKRPTYHLLLHIQPRVFGIHPDPPVTGQLVSGPGQASHFAFTVWKPGKSNILNARFDYTPNLADKAHPDVIHLLTKTGAVAAIVRYSAD